MFRGAKHKKNIKVWSTPEKHSAIIREPPQFQSTV